MKCIIENVDKNKPSCYTCIELQVGGNGMTPAETVKDLISRSSMQQKEVAEKMGWTEQAIDIFEEDRLRQTVVRKQVSVLRRKAFLPVPGHAV